MIDYKILAIIIVILSICCLLEFALLIKDRGLFVTLLKRAKQEGFIKTSLHLFPYVVKKIKAKTKGRTVSSDSPIKNVTNQIIIAFLFEGGYGDYLICANFFEYFRKEFEAGNVIFFIYGSGCLKDIFNYEIPNVYILDRSDFDFHFFKYDAAFKIAKRNQLMYANKEKLKLFNKNLYKYVLLCEKYMEENLLVFEMNPNLDGLNSAMSIAQGKKRIQEADIYGFLGVQEEFKYNLLIKENEEEYLEKLGLESKNFITIHRGWDSAYNQGEHVKAWSLKSCGNLITELKKKFPQYKIVVFGVSREQMPNTKNSDLDLIGKTTLNQVKVILKHAAIHIDNEGGMVHLRHALHGGASVVLFGPTAKELFGYSENINLASNVCSHWCEWLSPNWQYKCAKTGKNEHPCMDSITTKDILFAVKRILESF